MLQIFPIGGIGTVTKNMFVYEYGKDMILVDCGIGFPDESMPGVDFLIPDVTYLKEKLQQGSTLHAIFLTHGHDDHIAALPYVLQDLNIDIPIYGSPLTAEFAMSRMADKGVDKKVEYFDSGTKTAGPFTVETVFVTHSIPDTRHLAITTPEGTVYHGSDFKFDLTPVDGRASDYQTMARIGREGVLCAMIDCLRIERALPTPSESTIRDGLRREMRDVNGRVLVTLMSSSIHRIQQAIDVAAEFGRKVTFVGRSIEQNVNTAMNMGMLKFPPDMKLNKRNLDSIPSNEICVIIAGSQGQPGSSLVRAVVGEHRLVTVAKGDKIIFSSEPIPGSEKNVYRTINEIALQGVEVAYSDLDEGLHVSGHASEYEQMTLLHLLTPKYVFPIGGEERHRVQFGLTVQKHGYRPSQVVLPLEGKWVEFAQDKMAYSDVVVPIRDRTVDESGVVTVVTERMEERAQLGKNGVLTISLAGGDRSQVSPERVWIEMRGVTFGDDIQTADLLADLKDLVVEIARSAGESKKLKQEIERQVTSELARNFGSSPLVLASVISA